MIATLSTGPVGIADKAGDSNATLLRRSIRPDGLILQPDKPATSIDATFIDSPAARQPQGHIWSTYAALTNGLGFKLRWYYVLSIDVKVSWHLRQNDLFPRLDMSNRSWAAHRWHESARPTLCLQGELAVKSGCMLGPSALVESDLPIIQNDRPVMVANDTHQFDLLQLSPVLENGWVFLGDLTKYVSVSGKRFSEVRVTSTGIIVEAHGLQNESIQLTALRPIVVNSGRIMEWMVLQKTVHFESSKAVFVNFGEAKTSHVQV